MKKTVYIATLIILSLTACEFSFSSPKDGSKGISITEKGLSAGKVYLTDGEEEIDVRTFHYGQKIYTNFEDLDGFNTEDGKFYPEMYMCVLSKAGDTIMSNENMFADALDGFDDEVLTVNGHVILARPIYSGQNYVLHYVIKDAKSDAEMSSKMEIEVIRNPDIELKSEGLTISEAYIYSDDKKEVLNDGTFNFYENIRFDFQDLDGYVINDGSILIGMSVKVVDDNDDEILYYEDVFKDPITDEALLKQGVSATLIIQEGRVDNPLRWQVKIWDKNSDAQIQAEAEISVLK